MHLLWRDQVWLESDTVKVRAEKSFPCLAIAAIALFSMLPGAGGLENDIGEMKGTISPKRGRNPGLVEYLMMVKLCKNYRTYKTSELPVLGNKWQAD